MRVQFRFKDFPDQHCLIMSSIYTMLFYCNVRTFILLQSTELRDLSSVMYCHSHSVTLYNVLDKAENLAPVLKPCSVLGFPCGQTSLKETLLRHNRADEWVLHGSGSWLYLCPDAAEDHLTLRPVLLSSVQSQTHTALKPHFTPAPCVSTAITTTR